MINYQREKQAKHQIEQKYVDKKLKHNLTQIFKNQCKENLMRQAPPIFQNSFIKEKQKAAFINLQILQKKDGPFLKELLRLPIIQIHMFYTTPQNQIGNKILQSIKFKSVLNEIYVILSSQNSIKSISMLNLCLTKADVKSFNQVLSISKNLKELSIVNCQLTDDHLQLIKAELIKNQSLAIINFSGNKIRSGSIIAEIISKHSKRRDEIVWMMSLRNEPQDKEEDPSKNGLCQINLQNNLFDDKAASQLFKVLTEDQWIRGVNLRKNKIEKDGVKKLAMLMKKNLTIISLDLRQNPGLTKNYSAYIIRKLRENIERYRDFKQKHGREIKEQNLKAKKKEEKHKSMEQTRKKNQKTQIQFNLNNKTLRDSNKLINSNNSMIQSVQSVCTKCKEKTLQLFRLEKKNLDLHIQLQKVKKILLQKNIDINISAIQPAQQIIQHNLAFESFHKITGTHPESDEELITKVEQIMMELTKIMQNIEAQHNTEINMQNSQQNVNSLSNTIPLYSKNEDLQEAFGIRSSEMEQNEQNSSPNFLSGSNQLENQRD